MSVALTFTTLFATPAIRRISILKGDHQELTITMGHRIINSNTRGTLRGWPHERHMQLQ
jgi:hypothetical protein